MKTAELNTQIQERAIAILGVDGENFQVSGVYKGSARKPSSYILTRTGDHTVSVRDLSSFPSHQQVRDLMS